MNEFTNRATGIGERSSPAVFAHGVERVSRAVRGRYSVVEPLETSGTYELYLARDNSRGEEVIIRALTAGAALDFRRRELFYLESYAASLLSHVNIVAASSAEEANGIHFSIAEHKKDAQTLGDLLRRNGWLDLSRAVEIADQVASALDYAHSLGVLHLKLEPENILVEPDGWVSVREFGIQANAEYGWARELRARAHRAPYISHEQLAGAAGDHRADIYSLGAIVYEMLTDRVPYDSDDDNYIKDRQMTTEPAPPHMIHMDVPEEVSKIVMRLLERNPDARPDSAATVQAALDLAVKRAPA